MDNIKTKNTKEDEIQIWINKFNEAHKEVLSAEDIKIEVLEIKNKFLSISIKEKNIVTWKGIQYFTLLDNDFKLNFKKGISNLLVDETNYTTSKKIAEFKI